MENSCTFASAIGKRVSRSGAGQAGRLVAKTTGITGSAWAFRAWKRSVAVRIRYSPHLAFLLRPERSLTWCNNTKRREACCISRELGSCIQA